MEAVARVQPVFRLETAEAIDTAIEGATNCRELDEIVKNISDSFLKDQKQIAWCLDTLEDLVKYVPDSFFSRIPPNYFHDKEWVLEQGRTGRTRVFQLLPDNLRADSKILKVFCDVFSSFNGRCKNPWHSPNHILKYVPDEALANEDVLSLIFEKILDSDSAFSVRKLEQLPSKFLRLEKLYEKIMSYHSQDSGDRVIREITPIFEEHCGCKFPEEEMRQLLQVFKSNLYGRFS